jgi:hypothetical protein
MYFFSYPFFFFFPFFEASSALAQSEGVVIVLLVARLEEKTDSTSIKHKLKKFQLGRKIMLK